MFAIVPVSVEQGRSAAHSGLCPHIAASCPSGLVAFETSGDSYWAVHYETIAKLDAAVRRLQGRPYEFGGKEVKVYICRKRS